MIDNPSRSLQSGLAALEAMTDLDEEVERARQGALDTQQPNTARLRETFNAYWTAFVEHQYLKRHGTPMPNRNLAWSSGEIVSNCGAYFTWRVGSYLHEPTLTVLISLFRSRPPKLETATRRYPPELL